MAQVIKDLSEKGNDYSDKVNETLEKMADDLENQDFGDDKGQNDLMDDLAVIFEEAFYYEYHDFKNKKYPAPKVALVEKMQGIITNVKDGKYDN